MRYFIILLILVISSCAPVPGNTLYEGLVTPTALSDIESLSIVIDSQTTSKKCIEGAADNGDYLLIAAACLLNFCVVPGCSEVRWDNTGKITSCTVYLSWDWDWIKEHELRHCMGYKDIFY